MAIGQTVSQTQAFLAQAPFLSAVRFLEPGLTLAEKQNLANQLLVLIRNYYVHLPVKTSSLAIDPLQEVALLLDDIPLIPTDFEFFSRLIGIVKKLRDRHTSFKLPSPWANMICYLPFAVEDAWEGNIHRLIVTKLMTDLGDPKFVVGVDITHWNGIPIARYVEQLSWEMEGANPFARIDMTLRSLTIRPLAYMLPPDEDWVTLTYAASNNYQQLTVPWRVYFQTPSEASSQTVSPQTGRVDLALGLDRPTSLLNRNWLNFYSGGTPLWDADVYLQADPLLNVPNPLPDNLVFRTVDNLHGRYGYIRIFSFETADPVTFLQEFSGILKMMPTKGLIIDVRGNPGGTIPAGEELAQLFTDKKVLTEKVSFRVTQSLQQIANAISYFLPWQRSLNLHFQTGQVYSQGFSLSDGTEAAGLAGVYKRPLVVIIDALCYSTTDFFAAAIQDNGIGKIIGTDPVTGAGGANVWTHSQLLQFATAAGVTELSAMPRDCDMNMAIRRSERVGANDGIPLEGLGVSADLSYRLTPRDITGKNGDLVTYASYVLSQMR
jgi:hypothetical protein